MNSQLKNKFDLENYCYTVLVGQTNLLSTLIQISNKLINQTCINMQTKLEQIWMINLCVKMRI